MINLDQTGVAVKCYNQISIGDWYWWFTKLSWYVYPNQQPQVTAVSLTLQIFEYKIGLQMSAQQQKYQNYVFYIHTKILEVNLFEFAYRFFRENFSPIESLESWWVEEISQNSL